MKHHFADFLDRDGNYWTIVPNRERYEYSIESVYSNNKDIRIVTISKENKNWEIVKSLANLEELTLHEPSKEQIIGISSLTQIKRLRITHLNTKNIEFIGKLTNVEELVLEYVSGFSDLSPLRSLNKLKALHIENLRKVSNFGGLSGLYNLKYLHITGTLDWKQPIENFEFVNGLPQLEVLSFSQIITNSKYPALLPLLSLKNLKIIKIAWNILSSEEYAFLEVCLPQVQGTQIGPIIKFAQSRLEISKDDVRSRIPEEIIKLNHPDVFISYNGKRLINDPNSEWYEFIGKSAGRVKCNNPKAEEKCHEFIMKYNLMKEKAKVFIA